MENLKFIFGILIMVLISGCIYSDEPSQKTQPISSPTPIPTQKINFDMNGTFRIVLVPTCPPNAVNCNPKYVLVDKDGNIYQLFFNSGAKLPDSDQYIEVTGIVTYNTDSKCWLNEKEVPCQPIGIVNVLSWQPTPTPATSSLPQQEKLPNKTLRPISVVSVQPGCHREKLNGEYVCNAGGPAFTVTLNASSTNMPVTHLSVMLMLTEMQNNFSINFTFPDINQSNPLMPNQTASETSGAVVGPVYVLKVNGTPAVLISGKLQNGQSFSYWTNDTTS